MTEEEIIKGCIENNAQYQRLLFDRYAGKLFTVCRRYAQNEEDAKDLLQETFTKIYTHIKQYKKEGSFEGWMRRIAVNTALKFIQKKRIVFTELSEKTHDVYRISESSLSRLKTEELLKLIQSLPPGYRTVFNLNVIEGYSHEEIAALLHIHPASSRSQLSKARLWLQKEIHKLENSLTEYERRKI